MNKRRACQWFLVLSYVLANTHMESNGQGYRMTTALPEQYNNTRFFISGPVGRDAGGQVR